MLHQAVYGAQARYFNAKAIKWLNAIVGVYDAKAVFSDRLIFAFQIALSSNEQTQN